MSFPRWFVVLAIATGWWLSVAFVGAANQVVQLDQSWGLAVGSELVGCLIWVPLTVAIFALCTRVPLRRGQLARGIAIHLLAAVIVVLFRAVYIYGLNPWLHWYDVRPPFGLVLLHSVRHNLFQYFLMVGVAHAVIYANEALARARNEARLAAALGAAEQSALAATLQPHFLFNTLQAIAEMVHRDPEAADRMLVQLGAMLRRLLDDRRPSVPLRDELAFVADYLAIEEVRFGDQLAVRWEIAEDARDLAVPKLSIQPLVENAIRHGLWPAGRPGTLVIAARREGERLIVSVCDDGLGLAGTPGPRPSGYGLSTIRARLAGMYDGRGELAIAARAGQGVEARVVVPCEAACAS